jgi:hypothetical protein
LNRYTSLPSFYAYRSSQAFAARAELAFSPYPPSFAGRWPVKHAEEIRRPDI